MDYPHVEIYKGITLYYYLLPNEMPTGLKIEPVYDYIGGERCADGRIAKLKRSLVAIKIFAIYEGKE